MDDVYSSRNGGALHAYLLPRHTLEQPLVAIPDPGDAGVCELVGSVSSNVLDDLHHHLARGRHEQQKRFLGCQRRVGEL